MTFQISFRCDESLLARHSAHNLAIEHVTETKSRGWQAAISGAVNVGLTCRDLVQRQIADTRFISSACTEGGWAEIVDPS